MQQAILLHSPVLSRQQQRVALATLLIPVIGALAAIYWAFAYGISTLTWVVALVMYVVTTLGLTVGYHRLFTHKSFKPNQLLKAALAILGMMAAQGPVVFWVAAHRRHHAFSDTPNDCHSPLQHGAGTRGRLRGLWHAHFGWMLSGEITNVPMFAKDLLQDDLIVWLNRRYLLWVLLGLAIPVAAGYVADGQTGAVEGLLWGGLLRIFFVHQITWGLNSLNHVFGYRSYECSDNSRNIRWLALVTMGEGWHNNHHAYPSSARFGHRPSELDIGYLAIRLFGALGLCADIREPDATHLARKTVEH
jgi:stearoyl-CoA desaturase (delta-9 desaturase)